MDNPHDRRRPVIPPGLEQQKQAEGASVLGQRNLDRDRGPRLVLEPAVDELEQAMRLLAETAERLVVILAPITSSAEPAGGTMRGDGARRSIASTPLGERIHQATGQIEGLADMLENLHARLST
jgi:hypothetical protein